MKMEPVKFILCRPRSRSTWLAHFLGAGHDVSIFCKTKEDFLKHKIIVDTSLAINYGLIKQHFPDSKVYILYREEEECLNSLMGLGINPKDGFNQVSDAVERLKDILPIIEYTKLDDKEYLRNLYKELVDKDCTEEHLREFICTKIETIPELFFKEVKDALWS